MELSRQIIAFLRRTPTGSSESEVSIRPAKRTDSGYESIGARVVPEYDIKRWENDSAFQCSLCPKRYGYARDLHFHVRTHTEARSFDQKSHKEVLSNGNELICTGALKAGGGWGCGKRFTYAHLLGQHLRSDAGQACIKPLCDEETLEQQSQSHGSDNMAQAEDIEKHRFLPAALLVQYPALTQLDWESSVGVAHDTKISRFSSHDMVDWSIRDDRDFSDAVDPAIDYCHETPEQSSGVMVCSYGDRLFDTNPETSTLSSENRSSQEITIPPDSSEELQISQCVNDLSTDQPNSNSTVPVSEKDHQYTYIGNPCISSKDTFVLRRRDQDETARRTQSPPLAIESRRDVLKEMTNTRKRAVSSYDATISQGLDAVLQQKSFQENKAASSGTTLLDDKPRAQSIEPLSGDDSMSCQDSTSESDCTDSESSDSGSVSPIASTMSAYRKEAIESLMIEFKALLDQGLGVRRRASNSSGSTNGSSPARSSQDHRTGGRNGEGKKRKRDGEDPNSPEDGGKGEDDMTNQSATPNTVAAKKFACPYYRRCAWNHQNPRSCAGPGWQSVHRVKEHVYRQHSLPIHCPRCCTIFKTESELTTHQRLSQSCEVRIVVLPDGYNKEQEKALRKRKKTSASDEEIWKEMYMILFPDDSDDQLPTPYYEDDEVEAYERIREDATTQLERYLRRQLPHIVRRRLEQEVAESSEPLLSRLRGQLVDIVRESQSQLFRAYRESSHSQFIEERVPDASSQQSIPPVFDGSTFFVTPDVAGDLGNPNGDQITMMLSREGFRTGLALSDSGYDTSSANFSLGDSGLNVDDWVFPSFGSQNLRPPGRC
ncbi:putative C2H2-type domain-containing protein [Seiridium cardinale]|uniref:C2H2-type domain-containing protein n=1 Tax=Seiridium cardinale TaxID=138064 RepID=A0ABR2Y1T0_9PEZI